MSRDDTMTGLIARVQQVARVAPRTRMGDVIDALGQDSFIPQLMIPALAVVSPLSGVPLFSSLCGITIALVSVQMLAQRRRIWLPAWLLGKEVDSARLTAAIDRIQGPARWLDRLRRDRLQIVLRPPLVWVTQAICLICGLMMPFLELVPFTSSILGAVVALLAFGMLVRDGLFTVLGFLVIGGLAATVTLFVHGATV